MTDDIALPEDTRKSRLPKPHSQVMDEEFVTAAERFAEFRRLHPEGYVEATLDRVIEHPDGNVTYVMTAAAWLKRPGFGAVSSPDSTAWAQGSTNSDNTVIAGSPLESADTIARSRAIRNLGILDGTEPRTVKTRAPRTDAEIAAETTEARKKTGITQGALGDLMAERGFKWSQATVSAVENGERQLRAVEAEHLAELIGYGT